VHRKPAIKELKADLKEYESLRATAQRKRVQTALDKEIDQLRREVLTVETAAAKAKADRDTKSTGQEKTYNENITNYAWDQSDKFMKLYLTVGDLNKVSTEDIQSSFTDRSVTVKVKLANKICHLQISRLCEDVVAADCYCKKKSDYVLVMLKKSESGKTWPYVTEKEKKAKDKDMPKMDKTEDPNASITNMLKNMYDSGDDEMKRQIGKAMYESQMKQQGGQGSMDLGGMGGMGDLGGMGGLGGMMGGM